MKGEWERHCLPLQLRLWSLICCGVALGCHIDKCCLRSQIGYDNLQKYLSALFSYHRKVAVLQIAFSVLVKKEEAVGGPLCFTDFIVMLGKMIKLSSPWHLSTCLWTTGFDWDAALPNSCQGCLNKAGCACGFAQEQMNCNGKCGVWHGGIQGAVQWHPVQQLH